MKIDETGKTVLRVIVIEDDPDDLDLLLRELRRGGYLTKHAHVESRQDLIQALTEGPWDIIISDWSLPSFDGLAAFRVTREREADLPFIIVSGTIAEEHAVEALKAGVNDFITKGRFARLLPAIERELREAEMRRQKKLAEADLERQRLETAHSERLLRSVLQAVPDGVVVVDESGVVKEWSAGADTVLRMPRSQAPLSEWAAHYGFYQADRATPIAPLTISRELEREEVFLRNAGCPKGAWLHITSRALHGGTTGAVFVFHDVTKEKAGQEQLMISDRMASVGMLAAGVAHEINNPLGAALLNLESTHEILLRPPEARDEKELNVAMRDARSAVGRVREIVRDLKLFSRHEDGEKDRADVKEALESSLRMAFNEIRHRAGVVKEYGETLPIVVGSESRLGQVFLNLLVNAAQAIPEGNIEANVIRVSIRANGAGKVIVEISDSGDGIKPEDIPNLFTPFFTTKPPGIGTGLGLPICQRIIAQMGGDIQVESELGRGSTFRVILPAAAASANDGRSMRVPAISVTPTSHRRGRVLVVDDEEMLAAAIRRVLSRQHDVVTTTRALDALEKLRAGETFDVIFSDLMMPQITGMELFERITKEFPEHAPRVVFLTGGAFTQAAREFLAKVPNPTLEKPIDRQSLLSLVSDRVKEPPTSLAVGE